MCNILVRRLTFSFYTLQEKAYMRIHILSLNSIMVIWSYLMQSCTDKQLYKLFVALHTQLSMLNKNIPGAKKPRLSWKYKVTILIMHSTKKPDIWRRPRRKLFASSIVRSVLYISKGTLSHINYMASKYRVPLKNSISYTCILHEHISYIYVICNSLSIISLSIGHLIDS